MNTIYISIDKNIEVFEKYKRLWGKRGITGIRVDSMTEGIETVITIEKSRTQYLYFVDIVADDIDFMPQLAILDGETDAPILITTSYYNVDEQHDALNNGADFYGQYCDDIEKFKKEEYPKIAKRAKAENADIYWGDETGISNRENYEHGFAEKGHPPVLLLPTKQERVNMISAITNQGSLRFMVYEEIMNQQLLIDFMRRLIADSKRKVFFILDNLRVHHDKIVAVWLEKHKNEIEVFFLPPYAPESNPDEYLNHALKLDVHSGKLPRDKKEINHKIHSFMRRLHTTKNVFPLSLSINVFPIFCCRGNIMKKDTNLKI